MLGWRLRSNKCKGMECVHIGVLRNEIRKGWKESFRNPAIFDVQRCLFKYALWRSYSTYEKFSLFLCFFHTKVLFSLTASLNPWNVYFWKWSATCFNILFIVQEAEHSSSLHNNIFKSAPSVKSQLVIKVLFLGIEGHNSLGCNIAESLTLSTAQRPILTLAPIWNRVGLKPAAQFVTQRYSHAANYHYYALMKSFATNEEVHVISESTTPHIYSLHYPLTDWLTDSLTPHWLPHLID